MAQAPAGRRLPPPPPARLTVPSAARSAAAAPVGLSPASSSGTPSPSPAGTQRTQSDRDDGGNKNETTSMAALKERNEALEEENQLLKDEGLRRLASSNNADALLLATASLAKVKDECALIRSEKMMLQDEVVRLKMENARLQIGIREIRDQTSGQGRKNTDALTRQLEQEQFQQQQERKAASDAEKPALLDFCEDSPVFRVRMNEGEAQVASFGTRLRDISKAAGDFCTAGQAFSQNAGALAAVLCQDWSDVEDTNASLTLSEVMTKMGELLTHVQQSMGHLVLSVDSMLVSAIFEFRQQYIKPCKESSKVLKKASEDYEDKLAHYLGLKSGPKEKGASSFFSRKGKEPSEQELQEQLGNLKRRFELARFDHLKSLNELRTERVLDIIEYACAGFFGFITFFHEGEVLSQAYKPEVEALNARIQGRRNAYVALAKNTAEQRAKLERGLNTPNFMVRDAFPVLPVESGDAASAAAAGDAARRTTAVMRGKPAKIERQGYLYKQSSNLTKDWKRRWFVLKDGQLFYLRSEEDMDPQHVVDVLLCTVREVQNSELRHCFEIISPNKRTYMLQAESRIEMQDWIQVIQNCTENMIVNQDHKSGHQKRMSMATFQRVQEDNASVLIELKRLNSTCVDCGHPDPDWAAINLCIMMCIECSGIHRSLGVHVSKVRSVTLDSLDHELLLVMKKIGNAKFNALYEHNIPASIKKPKLNSSREERDLFIREKYVKKAFLDRNAVSVELQTPAALGAALYEAAAENEVEDLMMYLAFGADVNWQNLDADDRTAVFAACEHGNVLAIEYLCQNGAKLSVTDRQGKSPFDVATAEGLQDVVALLTRKSA